VDPRAESDTEMYFKYMFPNDCLLKYKTILIWFCLTQLPGWTV